MYQFAWRLLSPVRRLIYWLTKQAIRLGILCVVVVVLYFLLFSGNAGAQEPAFNFGKKVSLAEGFRPIKVPDDWDNSCSQYVVASLLSALGTKIDKPLFDEIGRAINPTQTGSYASDIQAYLESRFKCETHCPAKISDVVEHLEFGLPVITSVRVNEKEWHLVLVVGFAANPRGEVTELTIEDNGLIRGTYSPEEFVDLWNPKDSTSEPYCFLVSPSESTPAPQPLVVADNRDLPSPDTTTVPAGVVDDSFGDIAALCKKYFGLLQYGESTEPSASSPPSAIGKMSPLLDELVFEPVAAIRNPVKEAKALIGKVFLALRVAVCVVLALFLCRLGRFCLGMTQGSRTGPRYLT